MGLNNIFFNRIGVSINLFFKGIGKVFFLKFDFLINRNKIMIIKVHIN